MRHYFLAAITIMIAILCGYWDNSLAFNGWFLLSMGNIYIGLLRREIKEIKNDRLH